ncbi:hypothetical protein GCM10025882_28760 [Acinetobacter gyllenbergii]|uniref:DUF4882 domain-containing protein n=1 Tax=Acinetobacter gyllenbergii CIP 110306 = MTCC 11365 TaxID=1217657 RepID=A0A829HLG0_9GAMM|nr:DUF4882 family protein [Acinetobacter gyllenbergii]EPF88047.1 hypothetical protein F957_01334 [Acinetobacter gyllenbergii CIP 110306 = MTCC 11365]EPH35877.1 hypothetical protein L293_0470 [Acinetobacter gyllenbergii CIP 110306 = MTCC 11365]ESK55550.1 hypothetical protein F987_00560 [Acinetobacter gyllenbergii NIPH 230]GMA12451.1 hypothetical protein GCM10025882_28760 [Acinetobacter gyllenbergii]
MKKIILGAFLSTMITWSSFAACTYNLDATQAQLSQIDSTMTRFPNILGAKASFNVDASSSVKSYMSMSNAFANNKISYPNLAFQDVPGDKVISAGGTVAFEIKLKIPTYVLPAGETITFFPIQIAATNGNQNAFNIALIHVNGQPTNTNNNILLLINGGTQSSGVLTLKPENTADGYQTFGFYVNQNSKQIGYIFNGVNKGYISGYESNGSTLSFMAGGGTGAIATSASVVGQNLSIEFITDHTKLANTYPTGTKDICGTTL